jgi:hypothetical protein
VRFAADAPNLRLSQSAQLVSVPSLPWQDLYLFVRVMLRASVARSPAAPIVGNHARLFQRQMPLLGAALAFGEPLEE